MRSDANEIDWTTLKRSALPSSRTALDHLHTLAKVTTARTPGRVVSDVIPHASALALAVAIIATVRVIFGIVLALVFQPEATYAVPPALISASAAVFCGGGIVLWVGGERDWRARHLGLAYLVIGAAFTNVRHLGWIAEHASTSVASTAYVLRALATESFIPFFVIAFFETFPKVPADTWTQIVLLRLKRVTLALGVALASVNLLAWLWPLWTNADAPLPLLRPWLPVTEPPAYFWIVVFLAVSPALVLAVVKMRVSRGSERQRARLLLGGVLLALVPFCLALVALNTTPLRNNPDSMRAVAAFVYTTLLTLPITTAFAVLARGALDVRVLVRNAAHHALARWVLTIATVVPLVTTVALTWDYRAQTLESLLQMPIARFLLGTAATALVLLLVRTRFLSIIDRLFLRSIADAETMVADIGERTRRLPSARDVAADIVTAVERQFAIEHGAVFVRERGDSTFVALGRDLPPLPATSALVDIVATGDDVLTIDWAASFVSLLPGPDQAWVAAAKVEALVPLHGRGDRLIGFVVLGHRRGDWTYTPRERRTLKAVATAVAPVLERHLDAQLIGAGGAQTSEEPLLVCVECGTIHARDVRRCPCGGTIEGGVIPRVVGGKYEVTRRLGRGAMGVVYEARDHALERQVAIKALPHLSYREGERLVQEARRMTRVTHPNLAYVIGLETFNGMPLVVLELLIGRTLRERIARGPLPPLDVQRIGVALSDALARLHQAGLLHRDIKPGNVGFDADGTPKLLDFGLALPIEITRTSAPTLAGTPLYLPPEAWRGEPANHHMDLWGLAITLAEALLGAHPLAGITPEELEAGGATRAAQVVREHPLADTIGETLARAMAPDASARFPDAQAFRSNLAAVSVSSVGRAPDSTEQTA